MGPSASSAVTCVDHLLAEPGGVMATDLRGAVLPFAQALESAVAMILQVRSARGKVMVVGNGGSAAIATHLHTDLCGSLGVRGLVFHEPSLLTALANDHGYEQAFQRLVDLWGDPGDLLVAISSSGRSPNILRACGAARARGAGILTLSGFDPDNPLRGLGDINIHVASRAYGPVETSHGALVHHLTDRLMTILAQEVHP